MSIISSDNIDNVRKEGLRPEVVSCFLHKKKVFMFYNKKYHIWQFPQGGIDNLESIKDALKREMNEELGETFLKNIQEVEFLTEGRLYFSRNNWGTRDLRTDNGDKMMMRGKHYYAFATHTSTDSIIIDETEFDNYLLASLDQAKTLADKIKQSGKKRITRYFIDVLTTRSLIV